MALDDMMTAILADPETHAPVTRATPAELDALRAAIAAGTARRRDGTKVAAVEGAFLAQSGRVAYLVEDGVANFVIEERIEIDGGLQ